MADRLQRRLWIVVAGLVASNILVAAFLLLPARAERTRQEDELLDLQRRIRALQHESQSTGSQLEAVKEVEAYGQGFPPRAELVGLIERLTQQARTLAVDVPSVDYSSTEVKEAGLTKVSVHMGVQGAYGKIRRLLFELERMRRFLVIEQVTLHDPSGEAQLQLNLQLALYLRAAPGDRAP
jgi:Tfp pilus assembly protein PilO